MGAGCSLGLGTAWARCQPAPSAAAPAARAAVMAQLPGPMVAAVLIHPALAAAAVHHRARQTGSMPCR